MAEGFNGVNLFESGPRRYVVEPRGVTVIPRLRLNQPVSGSVSLGETELGVRVYGRLVGADRSALNGLLAAIEAQLTSPPVVGDLEDMFGQVWTGMSFVSFERRGGAGLGVGPTTSGAAGEGYVDAGRVVSVGYVARFVRFNGF
jgi:hypothetical protein